MRYFGFFIVAMVMALSTTNQCGDGSTSSWRSYIPSWQSVTSYPSRAYQYYMTPTPVTAEYTQYLNSVSPEARWAAMSQEEFEQNKRIQEGFRSGKYDSLMRTTPEEEEEIKRAKAADYSWLIGKSEEQKKIAQQQKPAGHKGASFLSRAYNSFMSPTPQSEEYKQYLDSLSPGARGTAMSQEEFEQNKRIQEGFRSGKYDSLMRTTPEEEEEIKRAKAADYSWLIGKSEGQKKVVQQQKSVGQRGTSILGRAYQYFMGSTPQSEEYKKYLNSLPSEARWTAMTPEEFEQNKRIQEGMRAGKYDWLTRMTPEEKKEMERQKARATEL